MEQEISFDSIKTSRSDEMITGMKRQAQTIPEWTLSLLAIFAYYDKQLPRRNLIFKVILLAPLAKVVMVSDLILTEGSAFSVNTTFPIFNPTTSLPPTNPGSGLVLLFIGFLSGFNQYFLKHVFLLIDYYYHRTLVQELWLVLALMIPYYLWLADKAYPQSFLIRNLVKPFRKRKMQTLRGIKMLTNWIMSSLSSSFRRRQCAMRQRNSHIVYPSWIHHACLYGHKDTVKNIMNQFSTSLNFNEQESLGGNTPLHLACLGRHLNVIQTLMSNARRESVDLTITNTDGQTAIDIAIDKGASDIVCILLKSASNEAVAVRHLVTALKQNHHDVVKILFDRVQQQETLDESIKTEINKYMVAAKHLTKTKDSKKRHSLIAKMNESKFSLVRKLAQTDVKQDQELSDEFECPVCLEFMSAPKKIYACSHDHMFCSDCYLPNKSELKSCPICRENFEEFLPKRRTEYEDLVKQLDLN